MKYCEEYAALLDGFVDGELTPAEMARVQAHLESCPGCQAYVDDALTIRAGFADIEDTIVPEGFAEGVMERIRKDGGRGAKVVELRRRSVWRWTGTLVALAACCALVILVRTGPGGLSGGGSDRAAGIVTASGGADAPAVSDMDGGEAGIAPQMEMAPGEAWDTAEAASVEGIESRAASEDTEKMTQTGEIDEEALPDMAQAPLCALPVDPAVREKVDAGAVLYLSAEEAGNLLNGLVPLWETETEQCYELSGPECEALLTALGWEEPLPETVQVVTARPDIE